MITAAGRARLRKAAPTHLRGIRDYMASRLEAVDLDALGAILGKLLPHGEPTTEPSGGCGASEGMIQRTAVSTNGRSA